MWDKVSLLKAVYGTWLFWPSMGCFVVCLPEQPQRTPSGSKAHAPSATFLKQTPEATVTLGVRIAQERMGPRLWHQDLPGLPNKDRPPRPPLKCSKAALVGPKKKPQPLGPSVPCLKGLLAP